MNDDEIFAIHRATEILFEDAKSYFDSKLAEDLAEYIRVGEAGLAIEALLYCVEREGLSLPSAQRDSLYAIAKRMGVDIEKLRQKWSWKPPG